MLYEYKVVAAPTISKKLLEDDLNKLAAEGWRVVTSIAPGRARKFVIMERERSH